MQSKISKLEADRAKAILKAREREVKLRGRKFSKKVKKRSAKPISKNQVNSAIKTLGGYAKQQAEKAAINLRNKSVSYTESACGVPKQLTSFEVDGAVNQEVNSNVQHCASFT